MGKLRFDGRFMGQHWYELTMKTEWSHK